MVGWVVRLSYYVRQFHADHEPLIVWPESNSGTR